MKRWIRLLIIFALVADTSMVPNARAQDEDLDRLFEEDPIEEPPPFGEPPPPGDFDNPPPGAGVPPQNTFNPPPAPAPSGGGFGTRPSGGGPAGTPKVGATSGDLKERFSKANIEDITNENFPETIESFDFPNADIKDVIKAISELTGKNFIIESSINGRVTIMAPSKITVAEAYKAFLSALAGIGYTVVPSGKFLKIKSLRNAQKDAIETFSGPYFPNADVLVTRIVQLKHTSAAEIDRKLKNVLTKEGDMTAYEPTNSLIITDFGSSIERTMRIIAEVDKPGFEEQLEVIPIRYAKAADLAEMLNQIINKDPGGGGGQGGFGRPGVPRFGTRRTGQTGGAPEELSLVAPDERTNALIVLGTKAGIEKVRSVIKKLDYRLDPSESGGVFVYHVKHGEAEKIQQVLQGVSQGGGSTGGGGGGGSSGGIGTGQPSATRPFSTGSQAVFGGDVKIQADKVTNSLVIVASKQDYETVKAILAQIDIPRDQVYVEAYIVEMNSSKTRSWSPAVYYFKDNGSPEANAISRSGFSGGNLQEILDPTKDSGAILGFGSGGPLSVKLGTQEFSIPSLIGFIKFLQVNVEANVLSTPQLLAMDNEDAVIEVGENVPVEERSTTGTGIQNSTPRYEKITMKMEITPYISPDSDSVRMKLKQTIKGRSQETVSASGGAAFPIFTDRGLQSNILVNSGDTAVLGGLVRDEESVTETKVPLLGDVPVLGWLFKSSSRRKSKVNLVIFLSPKIIRNQSDSQQQLTKKQGERIDWIKKNLDGRDPFGETINNMPKRASGRGPSSAKKRR